MSSRIAQEQRDLAACKRIARQSLEQARRMRVLWDDPEQALRLLRYANEHTRIALSCLRTLRALHA